MGVRIFTQVIFRTVVAKFTWVRNATKLGVRIFTRVNFWTVGKAPERGLREVNGRN